MLGVTTPMAGGGFFLRVDGGYGGTDGSHTSYMAAFTISSAGVWTLLSCNYLGHSVSGNHGGAHQVNVGSVVRLL